MDNEENKNFESTSRGSTPYDDVFQTLVTEHKKLLPKLINEMFPDVHYEGDEVVRLLKDTFFFNKDDGQQDKKITDSAIEITGHDGVRKLFHLECQSNPDGTMIIRMFEYDVQIALKANSDFSTDHLEVNLPESGILYLRSTSSTPDFMSVTVHAPSGDQVSYKVPILKLKNYSCDEILDKELYFLIPFYLFNFESEFDKIEAGKQIFIDSFKTRYREIYDRLRERLESGQIDLITHHSLIMLSKKIISALAGNKAMVKEEAEKIMGGQVLDYETKQLLREGRAEGMTEVNSLYAWLRDNGRTDDILRAIGDEDFLNSLLSEFKDKK